MHNALPNVEIHGEGSLSTQADPAACKGQTPKGSTRPTELGHMFSCQASSPGNQEELNGQCTIYSAQIYQSNHPDPHRKSK